MEFTYCMSVVLLSFAIFGGYCFVKDLWLWHRELRIKEQYRFSMVILVKDIENDIEEMLRHLMMEIEIAEMDCEVIVYDDYSQDLTFSIAKRLEREYASLTVMKFAKQTEWFSHMAAATNGNFVQLLDTIHCIKPEEFCEIVTWIFKPHTKQFIL